MVEALMKTHPSASENMFKFNQKRIEQDSSEAHDRFNTRFYALWHAAAFVTALNFIDLSEAYTIST